ncbi:hypothetical protein HCU40_19425 (plasmid) [Pseudanabaena biceps]|nr:hypothetical protein [Pseudanabaena biceps]
MTLASLGFKALWIDGDPQHNLSLYGRSPHQNDEPTLLECITGQVQPIDAIYPTDWENRAGVGIVNLASFMWCA